MAKFIPDYLTYDDMPYGGREREFEQLPYVVDDGSRMIVPQETPFWSGELEQETKEVIAYSPPFNPGLNPNIDTGKEAGKSDKFLGPPQPAEETEVKSKKMIRLDGGPVRTTTKGPAKEPAQPGQPQEEGGISWLWIAGAVALAWLIFSDAK